jgi:hypothetical protein
MLRQGFAWRSQGEVLARHGALRSLGEAGRVYTKLRGNKLTLHAATLTTARIRATMTAS